MSSNRDWQLWPFAKAMVLMPFMIVWFCAVVFFGGLYGIVTGRR